MDNERHIVERLIREVNLKFGHRPGSPADFQNLIKEIYEKTGETIGLSTVKRLWGYIRSEHTPSYTILSILSQFVGFSDYNSFKEAQNNGSVFFEESVNACDLQPGNLVLLKWHVDKSCTLKRLEAQDTFCVLDAHNIKLLPGDTFTIASLCKGMPFQTGPIIRQGESKGIYIGARPEGLQSIQIIKV